MLAVTAQAYPKKNCSIFVDLLILFIWIRFVSSIVFSLPKISCLEWKMEIFVKLNI